MKKWGLMLVATVWVAGAAQAADRLVDYAAQKAANDAVAKIEAKLAKDGVDAGNIAFLPLFADDAGIYPVVRAELTGIDSDLKFFMREPEDWQKLVKEVEFGQKRGDIMNKTTIQRFGSIEGVDALLYGEVREAGAKNEDESIVRITLYLANVETGEQMASAIAEGVAEKEMVPEPPAKPEPTAQEKALAFAAENWKVIGLGLGVVVVLLVFITKTTRPR
jgi:hypothetical protein